MSAQLNAPLLTMVVALDVVASGEGAQTRGHDDFARLLVSALGQRCAIQRFDRAGEPSALSLVLLPNESASMVAQRLVQTCTQYAEQMPGFAPRAAFHQGVVFSAEESGRSHFVGSAIRSAQSLLRRLPRARQCVATKDFVEFAASFTKSELRIAKIDTPNAVDELWQVEWAGEQVKPELAAVAPPTVQADDPLLHDYLTSRLAQDIGPFASAIVDSAVSAGPTLTALIDELAREIDDASARARFRKDVDRHIASMDKRSLRYLQNQKGG